MILPTPSEIQAKLALDVPSHVSPSPSLRTPPPPVHPALQYGVASSTASPPGYQATRKPLSSITYTFWPQTTPPNSMVLAPPLDLDNPRPSYCISVNLNCFTPTSHVTTIRRGSWEGEFVGDFEIGLSNSKKPNTLCIRGNEHHLSDILKSGYQPFRNTWTWRISDHDKPISLFWDDSAAGGVLTCFSSKDKTTANVVARFIPPAHLRRHGRPAEMNRLEVSPQGHDYFDDILLCALILERIRTTPSL
ncbi:hypothetical protein Hypma_015805 [Hypsizygus marmoreus]|uniref:DUF6593 domain-containing protein n=1 Tax=Hypsizygus marmoreus TaxID=39966 RepID=A0A369KDA3_HYPMA|nr:hypothetical protein Hypma_015805 [Hypsizygus marmoreus]